MENDFIEDLIKTFFGEENITLYHVVKNFIENGFDIKKTLLSVELDKILPLVLSMTASNHPDFGESEVTNLNFATDHDVNEVSKRLSLF